MSAPEGARIPCLDGLRAISIALVILSHIFNSHGGPRYDPMRYGDIGNLGVRVFFVISGFLITTLLVTEIDRTGRISLRQFYLRRMFRIFPAFYAYIAVIAAASAIGWVRLRRYDLLAAVTYTINYRPHRGWELGHLWSLAVEEQFYLLWPAVVAFLGKRRGLYGALAAMCIAPILRVVLYLFFPSQRDTIGEGFHTVCDSLATGCTLALLRDRMTATPWIARVQSRGATPVVLALVVLVANYLSEWTRFGYPFGQTIVNVSIALVIDACVRSPRTPFARLLELRPLAFIGTLSYSIYLWQQPFMWSQRRLAVMSYPLNVVSILVVALVSYYVIERPMLELRKRFSRAGNKAPPAEPPRLAA